MEEFEKEAMVWILSNPVKINVAQACSAGSSSSFPHPGVCSAGNLLGDDERGISPRAGWTSPVSCRCNTRAVVLC